jgi:Fur family transcriptional regulator, ferric uptake regulator
VDSGKVIEFQDPAHERLMQVTAERLGFELVSLRLELFGRRVAQDDKRPTRSRGRGTAVEGPETDPQRDRAPRWVPR